VAAPAARAGHADRRADAASTRNTEFRVLAGRRQPADAHVPAEQAAAVRHLSRVRDVRRRALFKISQSNIST
jgi:hypothetical protein